MRAPTPSAAAELAVYEYQTLQNYLEEKKLKLKRSLYQKIQFKRMKLEAYRVKMTYLHPRNKLREQQQRCVEFEQKIRNIMERRLNLAKQRLAISIEKMKGASPLAKLNQGFSYVSSEAGNVVKSIENVKLDDKLNIYMTDGIVRAKVVDTMKEDYNGRTNIGNSI